jgi:hypothetical protein
LGYSDFSEWMLAHSDSTYYQQSEKKRAEVFAKVEPSLTYLDALVLESKHAHAETRLEQSQEDYRRLADELRLQREEAQLLEQRLKQQREEYEQLKQQQDKFEDSLNEDRRLNAMVQEVLRQHGPSLHNEIWAAIFQYLARHNEEHRGKRVNLEHMRKEILRFVQKRRRHNNSNNTG